MSHFNKLMKALPYISAILVGFVFFYAGTLIKNENLKTLLCGLATTFLGIFLVFLFFDLIKHVTERKLNQELYDFFKTDIDAEIFSIMATLARKIYPYEYPEPSANLAIKLWGLSKKEMINLIKEHSYLGFQIYKSLNISGEKLRDLLVINLNTRVFQNHELILLVNVIKEIYRFDRMLSSKSCYKKSKNMDTSFKISGEPIFGQQKAFRFMLLKKIDTERFLVQDSGDFFFADEEKLLSAYLLNPDIVEEFALRVCCIISAIKKWGNLAKGKFLLGY